MNTIHQAKEVMIKETHAELHMFSICTLVTCKEQYAHMLDSFQQAGFTDHAEFLFIDNTKHNQCSATIGLNHLIAQAKFPYIILCHQDIELHDNNYDDLLNCIDQLEGKDTNWALAGNAGAMESGAVVLRISDPHGTNQHLGDLPAKVVSLDENFIILKKSSLLGFSIDLTGFHLYGTDICMNAYARGFTAYVINFHLLHHSGGNIDTNFSRQSRWLEKKYRNIFRARYLKTTCTVLVLSSSKISYYIMTFLWPWRRRVLKWLKYLRLSD